MNHMYTTVVPILLSGNEYKMKMHGAYTVTPGVRRWLRLGVGVLHENSKSKHYIPITSEKQRSRDGVVNYFLCWCS